MKFKNFNLGIKLSITISAVIFAVMMAATIVISRRVENHVREIHYRAAEELALRYSREILATLNSPLYTARTLAQIFETMKFQGKSDRAVGDQLLKEVLEKNPDFISTWTTWEPNAFDGRDAVHKKNPDSDSTGRYCPAWARTKSPIQLEPPVEYQDEIKNSYYSLPRNADHEIINPPLRWNSLGTVVYESSLIVPIHYRGKFVGLAGVDVALDTIREKVFAIKPMGTGYACLMSQEGKYVAHPGVGKTDLPITNAEEKKGFDQAQRSEVFHQIIKSDYLNGVEVFSVSTPIVIGHTLTPWVFQANIPVATILEPVGKVRNTIFLVSLLLILIASSGLYFLIHGIVLRPLRRVEQYAAAVSSGKEAELSPQTGRFHGELQRVMTSIEKMVGLLERRYDELQEKTRLLEESEKRMGLLLQQSPLAVIEWDAAFRVVRWNPAAEKIFGYSAQEAFGKHGGFILPDLESGETAEDWRQLLSGKRIHRIGVKNLTQSGQTIICDWHSAPLVESQGVVVGAVSLGLDITQHKLLEEQLRQAQKMEAIGPLAGGIAHDFNNILGAIWGYAELGLNHDTPLEPEIREYLEQVLKAAQRAKDLVRQILTFSRRSESAQMSLEISALAKEAMKLLRASIPTTIEMNFEQSPQPFVVMADSTQIHQVLMNLCTNAAHAMKSTGGKLLVSLREEFLTPTQAMVIDKDLAPGHYAKISVQDTGPGIRPEHLSRLFEPFFTTKSIGEGTGMGLAVAIGIVKNHGGTIRALSAWGKGARFEVFLPLRQETSVELDSPSVPALPRGSGERILLVDDDEDLSHVHKSILEKLGYAVLLKGDAASALDLFREQPDLIDLVFTDQTMPGMTGIMLAVEMLKIRQDLPIVLCSGYSDAITPEEAKAKGVKEYLLKPLSLPQLACTISGSLQNPVRRNSPVE